jgi:hypothetical protein
MDLNAAWRSAFQSWPANLPKVGMIVTSTQETVPFVNFLVADSFVIVERDKPDSQGARKLIIALAAITAVKLSITEDLQTLAPFAEGKKVEEEGFGMPAGLSARASAAARRTADPPRRPF